MASVGSGGARMELPKDLEQAEPIPAEIPVCYFPCTRAAVVAGAPKVIDLAKVFTTGGRRSFASDNRHTAAVRLLPMLSHFASRNDDDLRACLREAGDAERAETGSAALKNAAGARVIVEYAFGKLRRHLRAIAGQFVLFPVVPVRGGGTMPLTLPAPELPAPGAEISSQIWGDGGPNEAATEIRGNDQAVGVGSVGASALAGTRGAVDVGSTAATATGSLEKAATSGGGESRSNQLDTARPVREVPTTAEMLSYLENKKDQAEADLAMMEGMIGAITTQVRSKVQRLSVFETEMDRRTTTVGELEQAIKTTTLQLVEGRSLLEELDALVATAVEMLARHPGRMV